MNRRLFFASLAGLFSSLCFWRAKPRLVSDSEYFPVPAADQLKDGDQDFTWAGWVDLSHPGRYDLNSWIDDNGQCHIQIFNK
jgi:hypothetical protein